MNAGFWSVPGPNLGRVELFPTTTERDRTKGGRFGHARQTHTGRPTQILPGLRPATEAQSFHTFYTGSWSGWVAALGVHFQKQECLLNEDTATRGHLPCLRCITRGLISNEHPDVPVL